MEEWMIRVGDFFFRFDEREIIVVAVAIWLGLSALGLWCREFFRRCREARSWDADIYDAEWMDAEKWEATR